MESAKKIPFKLGSVQDLKEIASHLTVKESFILLSPLERGLDSVAAERFFSIARMKTVHL